MSTNDQYKCLTLKLRTIPLGFFLVLPNKCLLVAGNAGCCRYSVISVDQAFFSPFATHTLAHVTRSPSQLILADSGLLFLRVHSRLQCTV
jgi:hypothetical protein